MNDLYNRNRNLFAWFVILFLTPYTDGVVIGKPIGLA